MNAGAASPARDVRPAAPFHRRFTTVHHLLLSLATRRRRCPTSDAARTGITEDQVTPGLLGFIMTAFFVVATALLIVDMVRRIRRVRYRAQVEEERLAAAEAADIAHDDAANGNAGRTDT